MSPPLFLPVSEFLIDHDKGMCELNTGYMHVVKFAYLVPEIFRVHLIFPGYAYFGHGFHLFRG